MRLSYSLFSLLPACPFSFRPLHSPPVSTKKQNKQNLFDRLGNVVGAGAPLRAEKARLEAFLDAVPGEYCGWSPDGTVAYSEGFCRLLGLDAVNDVNDIQNSLSPSDAAVLEGLYVRLQEEDSPFSTTVRTADQSKILKLTGSRGHDLEGRERFDIIWLEDVTDLRAEQDRLERQQGQTEDERDRLQAALDQIPIPLWMRNARTEIIWCNRSYAKGLDTSPATVVAEQKELSLKAVSKHAPLKAAGKSLAQLAFDSGKPEYVRSHVILDGSRRLMNVCEIPLSSVDMALGIAQDITREEDLETEQRRYAAANKELLEQLGTAIGIFDSNERLEFYNSAFSQLWALEDLYLNTKPKLADIMEKLRETQRLPEQADFRKFKQTWLSMFTHLINPHEDMLYLPDGSALRMLAVPHPMGGLMMTFEDVTSRLELESSYNTLIAVQKETLDNLSEGVAVYGGDGRLKLWNPAFAGLWKLNPEDMESEPHTSKLTEKMKLRFSKKTWEKRSEELVAQSIGRKIREGRMECSDGTLIAYSTVPLPDGGVLVTHIDMTDSMRVEKALREKNAALEAAEQLKLDFLANVSYQLRTPLNAIMGFSEILDHEYFGPLNKRQKEYTKGMHEAGDRLLGLINDILDLSTIEAGYMELQHDDVAIKDIVESIHGLTDDWARKEKVSVKLDCPKNIGTILADGTRLKQVLLNLVRNAITHTPEGDKILLQARRVDGFIEISVTDTGPGISQKDQERIFEPFERVQGHSGHGGGAGLGLTLVKNIIEMHGGHVSLKSEEGKGTMVTIHLPLVPLEPVSRRNKKKQQMAS